MNGISVVIPTYNRNEQLSDVLDHLLASDVEDFKAVEIIVVDDGSPEPARAVVTARPVVAPFELRYIRQENAGPAAARNNGFQTATHEVVLFIDDDVLVLPDVLRKHVKAHADVSGSVVHGPYPYLMPEHPNAEYRFLSGLIEESHKELTRGIDPEFPYVKVTAVASGNLSVEKQTFCDKVYMDGLEIPAGEEFEMNARLRRLGIPIYFAPEIMAWHLQPPTIEGACVQNYKYGLGIAEVAVKEPEVKELKEFRDLLDAHSMDVSVPASTKLKRVARWILAARGIRNAALRIVTARAANFAGDWVLFAFYRLLIGTYFYAGFREGRRKYGW